MRYCTLTCDRGDRPHLFERCIQQLRRMNNDRPPMNGFIMNDPPKNGEVDLVPRFRQGVEYARNAGFTHLYCIESDDFYTFDYLKRPLDFDFFGYSDTTYYHLRNRTYANFIHPRRSSLFTTAFKISALNNFVWPPDNTIFLDVELWKFAMRGRFKVKLLKGNPCLGLKHSIGLVGGKGHRMTFKNKDPELKFLQSRTDPESFQFYKDLMLTL